MATVPCPHCGEALSDDEVYDLLNTLMALRTAVCPHKNTTPHLVADFFDDTLVPTHEMCDDCGTLIETEGVM